MTKALIALIVIIGFVLLLWVITLIYFKILERFDKYIVKQVKEHGQILEVNGIQKWYSDWYYSTQISKFKFLHQDNNPITITRTGNTSIKVNNAYIHHIHEFNIKFEDGYVLEYQTVYPEY